MNIKQRILQLLGEIETCSVIEMVDRLQVSKQGIHLALRQLIANRQVAKFGKVPKTIYKLNQVNEKELENNGGLDEDQIQFLSKNFLSISESGEIMSGWKAFRQKYQNSTHSLKESFREFALAYQKNQNYFDTNGLINGLSKIKKSKTPHEIYLDNLFFMDFECIEQFDKTKLGNLLYFAKTGQNTRLMKALLMEIKDKIYAFAKFESFDCIAFIPPTIRRENQIMKYLKIHLKTGLHLIEIKKISGIIPIPQHSLQQFADKVFNAENSYSVAGFLEYKHILLIDDIVDSGATMNAVAKQIKLKKIAKKVTGLSIVGDFRKIEI